MVPLNIFATEVTKSSRSQPLQSLFFRKGIVLPTSSNRKIIIFSVTAGAYANNAVADVIMDSTVSLMLGPKNIVDGIAAAVGGRNNSATGPLYAIPCNAQPPDIIITIGANRYNINYMNYILGVRSIGFRKYSSRQKIGKIIIPLKINLPSIN